MTLLGVIFVAAFGGVPVWLISRAWRMYFPLDRQSAQHLLQVQAGLAVLSLSTGAWLAVLLIMTLEDRSARMRAVGQHLSPVVLAVGNLALCLCGLACARLRWKTAGESLRLRKAMLVSSGCLTLIWLLILANPH